MLSLNEASNFPVLPWDRKIRKIKSSNISPDKGSQNAPFCALQKGLKLAFFFIPLQYIYGLEFVPLLVLSHSKGSLTVTLDGRLSIDKGNHMNKRVTLLLL
jgi:hypothetical protein